MTNDPTGYDVRFSRAARQDIQGIRAYIAAADSAPRATRVVNDILEAASALASFPERGSRPQELLELGINTYRQTMTGAYRMVYRVDGRTVLVVLIADGRRDMQSLLAQRLLAA